MKIILRWNEKAQQFYMFDKEGNFIYNFFPCKKFMEYFDNPSKEKNTKYELKKPLKG